MPLSTLYPFGYCSQSVLPAVYDDSLSYAEMVCRLTAKVNEVLTSTTSDISDLQKAVQELYEFVHGTSWESAVRQWVNDNLPCLVAQVCKWFHFGIDDQGHVVCTIPTSWQDFGIHWITDTSSPDFGKIVIGWN